MIAKNAGKSTTISMAMPPGPGQYGAMHPKERIRGFTPAAAMLDEIVETTQNNNKAQLLACNYGTNFH
jgi:hypothetical protein